MDTWEKLIATGAEKAAALDIRARAKAKPPTAPEPSLGQKLLGLIVRYTPVALIPGVAKTPEELRADPRSPSQMLTDKFKDLDIGGLVRWIVVGLVALAGMVIVPRLLARK